MCDPIDGSPPGSPVPGILQARTLEWVAISFSSAWKWKVKVKLLCCVWLFTTPWTAAYQAPPSVGFSRQEYWSGVPLPSPYHPLLESKYYKPSAWDMFHKYLLNERIDESSILSCARFFATPWTIVAHQAPLSMEFSRQERWRGSFWLRDRTSISCTGTWILYHCVTWEASQSMSDLKSLFSPDWVAS